MACDKHVVKMCVETGQIISTVWWKVSRSRYKLYHSFGWLTKQWVVATHPAIMWAALSHGNYQWLLEYWGALLSEYTLRYGKIHAYQALHNNVVTMMPDPPLARDDFVVMSREFQALPEDLKSDDPVEAYRRFYIRDKSRFARWKFTPVPHWWPLQVL